MKLNVTSSTTVKSFFYGEILDAQITIDMAEAVGLAASILGIVGVAVKITKTLRDFGSSFNDADITLLEMYETVELTKGVLRNTASTVSEYAEEFGIAPEGYELAKNACWRNLKRLDEVLEKTNKSNNTRSYHYGTSRLNLWKRLAIATGGEDKLKSLASSIQVSKSNMESVMRSVDYMVNKALFSK
jgi:hypothetical protein